MRVGVFVSETWGPPPTVAQVQARAAEAERFGFASAWAPYLPWSVDALAALQAAATVTDRIELGTQLVELRLDCLVGLLCLGIVRIQLVVFCLQRIVASDLLGAELLRLGVDAPHSGGVAIGKADRRLHPFPAFSADRLGIPGPG